MIDDDTSDSYSLHSGDAGQDSCYQGNLYLAFDSNWNEESKCRLIHYSLGPDFFDIRENYSYSLLWNDNVEYHVNMISTGTLNYNLYVWNYSSNSWDTLDSSFEFSRGILLDLKFSVKPSSFGVDESGEYLSFKLNGTSPKETVSFIESKITFHLN